MKEAFEKLKERLEVEIESSDKYIREYDSSEVQVAWNKGMRHCISIVSEVEAEYINKSTGHINKLSDCSTGWIPCSERLPETDGWYLTCDHKGNIHVFYHHPMYEERDAAFGICENHPQFYKPIAWMPLPEPYRPIG